MKKHLLFLLISLSILQYTSGQTHTTEVLPGNNGKVLFKIQPDGHYEWYKEKSTGTKVNSYDTSFYEANETEYTTGPTTDCPAGEVCLFAVDLANRRGTMRPLSSPASMSDICGSFNQYMTSYLLIETLSDSVSLDTLEVIQPAHSDADPILFTYKVSIKSNDPNGLFCNNCPGGINADGPGTLLFNAPVVSQYNIRNQKQMIKIPVSYLFETAGRYWISLPYETGLANFLYLNCQLPLSAGSNLWVTPQYDNTPNPLAKAITSYHSDATTGLYGAFFNMDFTLRKNCISANDCERIKVSGPNPITAELASKTNQTSSMLYPNPAKSSLFIKTTNETIQNVTLLNLSGEIIISEKTNELNLQNIPSGMYMIKIDTGTDVYFEKLFIE